MCTVGVRLLRSDGPWLCCCWRYCHATIVGKMASSTCDSPKMMAISVSMLGLHSLVFEVGFGHVLTCLWLNRLKVVGWADVAVMV